MFGRVCVFVSMCDCVCICGSVVPVAVSACPRVLCVALGVFAPGVVCVLLVVFVRVVLARLCLWSWSWLRVCATVCGCALCL